MGMVVSNLDSQREPASGCVHLSKTVGASAVSLPDPGDNAKCVFFSVDGGDVRVRFDGTDPTASVGILLKNGGVGTWSRGSWIAAKLIAASGSPIVYGQGME